MKFLESPLGKFIFSAAVLFTAFISSIVIYVVQTDLYSSFVPADGVITDIEWLHGYPEKYARIYRRHSIGSNATHRIHYSFEVDGENYGGSDLSYEKASKYKVGDTVKVWYNPNYPDHSTPYEPQPGLEVLVPYFLAAPIIILSVFISKRKSKALYSE